jgi:hypothetical protein
MAFPILQSGPPQALPGRYFAFYRDTALAPGVRDLYQVGINFREPSLCDATYKFGGFAALHRYLIVSAGAPCLDRLSPDMEWGQCVWLPGRIFKVIGVHAETSRRRPCSRCRRRCRSVHHGASRRWRQLRGAGGRAIRGGARGPSIHAREP